MERIYAEIDRLKEKYLQFWVDICNLESPTANKEAVDAVGRFAAQKAEELGWKVEFFHHDVSGDVVCITMNPTGAKKHFVLSGHMDTVHPIGSFGTPAVHIADGKIFGPGVTDCKGGIVVAFLVMEALQNCGYTERPIKLLLQSDEEVGSSISNKATIGYILEQAKGCVGFLNGEGNSGDRKFTTTRKGILRFRLEITGKACHSSKCYDGANAITEAAHKIIELEKWKEEKGITCNCGIIEGGTTPNTVAEHCTVVADIRHRTAAEAELVKKRVAEIAEHSTVPGTTCKWTQISYRVAMEETEPNQKFFNRINEIFAEAGYEPIIASMSNGGSDAADATAAGIPVLDSFGVQGAGIHSVQEYAYIESLPDMAKKTALIIKNID